MSDITLEDIANEGKTGVTDESSPTLGEVVTEEQPQLNSRFSDLFNRILTAETGEGSIEEYIDHPMNFKNSKGLAQMLRGFTGIIGNLKLAVIDVVFGFLRFSSENKGGNMNDRGISGVTDIR